MKRLMELYDNGEDERRAKRRRIEESSQVVEVKELYNNGEEEHRSEKRRRSEEPSQIAQVMELEDRSAKRRRIEEPSQIVEVSSGDSDDCVIVASSTPPSPQPIKEIGEGPTLSAEQEEVVAFILDPKETRSVFLTGVAGSGKSEVIQRIVKKLKETGRDNGLFITASTGVAASKIGGTTVHSFSGIGIGKDSAESIAYRIKKRDAGQRLRQARTLIIDEISLLAMETVDLIDVVCRIVRGNDAPFGGIRIIFVGDFLQLPPVTKKDEEVKFAFDSEAWKKLNPRVFNLAYSHRQHDDPQFADFLSQCRLGIQSRELYEALMECVDRKHPENEPVTTIMPRTADAAEVNEKRLEELPEQDEHTYTALDQCITGNNYEHMGNSYLRNLVAVEELRLRVGAQVMLLWNIAPELKLCNGSVGVVTRFDEETQLPYVNFPHYGELLVHKRTWTLYVNGFEVAARSQVPLILAWAITSHKSQGQTITSNVVADLGTVFAEGQAYVILSRVLRMTQLSLKSFDASAIRANAHVLDYYRSVGCFKEG